MAPGGLPTFARSAFDPLQAPPAWACSSSCLSSSWPACSKATSDDLQLKVLSNDFLERAQFELSRTLGHGESGLGRSAGDEAQYERGRTPGHGESGLGRSAGDGAALSAHASMILQAVHCQEYGFCVKHILSLDIEYKACSCPYFASG